MGGTPRKLILYEGCIFHVAWRCHNKNWFFRDARLKALYYKLLLKFKNQYRMTFYGYHFMENHVHLIGKTESIESFSNYFRVVHNLFARKFNYFKHRRGQVVMERIKSIPINENEELHLLTVLAYIDLNGVRSGRDKAPTEGKWSSYQYYAFGKPDKLLTPAPSFLGLSENIIERQKKYQTIVESLASHRR